MSTAHRTVCGGGKTGIKVGSLETISQWNASFAYCSSSSLKSGCAIAIMDSARSLKVFPERFAMPYSVETLWIMVRGAETVEPRNERDDVGL